MSQSAIRILITGAGYQGCATLIRKLKELDERFYFIGVDTNPNSAAKKYCDCFYEQKNYEYALVMEHPQLVIPGTSMFIPLLSKNKELIMASSPTEVITCLSKTLVYNKLKGVLPLPQYIDSDRFVIKPKIGKGARGIEYRAGSEFPMEFLEGEQIDVDVLSLNGELLMAMCKTRERAYGGTAMEMEIVNRSEIVAQIKKALKVLPLSYLSVWQFIGGKLLEVNPRLAGAIFYPEGWNMPYLAIKLALKEIKPKDIKSYQIPYGRRMARYLDQYEY